MKNCLTLFKYIYTQHSSDLKANSYFSTNNAQKKNSQFKITVSVILTPKKYSSLAEITLKNKQD